MCLCVREWGGNRWFLLYVYVNAFSEFESLEDVRLCLQEEMGVDVEIFCHVRESLSMLENYGSPSVYKYTEPTAE